MVKNELCPNLLGEAGRQRRGGGVAIKDPGGKTVVLRRGGKPKGMKLVLGAYPHLGVEDVVLALGLLPQIHSSPSSPLLCCDLQVH